MLHMSIDRCVEALGYMHFESNNAMDCSPKSLSKVLENIVLTLKHKVEIIKSLLQSKDFSPDSFTWKHHLHYSIDGTIAREDGNGTSCHSSTTSFQSLSSSRPGSIHMPIMKSSQSSLAPKSLSAMSKHSSLLVSSSKSLLGSKTSLPTANRSSKAEGAVSAQTVSSAHRYSPMECTIHSLDCILPYGFEYYGRCSCLVLTPNTESCLLSVLCAIREYVFPDVCGERGVGKTETVRETAMVNI